MLLLLALLASLSLGIDFAALQPRLDDGVVETPHMGPVWSSYNHYSCSPNETTIRSNEKALVDLGLDKLGYRYVGIDCGWTVADRLPNGSLIWNETLFPSGVHAVGQYIHDLDLLFGVYEDEGIKTGGTGIDQAGSLSSVGAHDVMLLELRDTTTAGVYASEDFATVNGVCRSCCHEDNHLASIVLKSSKSSSRALCSKRTDKIPLTAGSPNEVTTFSTVSIKSIRIASPSGTYYACTSFTLCGSTKLEVCDAGFCTPVGSKVGYINAENTVHATIPARVTETGSEPSTASKYLEIDYINNDIAFATSWDWGSSSRNLTISLNSGNPVRLEVPLSGRHSELFGPGKRWWDSSKLGILIDGWKNGSNGFVTGNEVAGDVSQTYGADFVGLRLYD
ncbi:hypothetical protein N7519_004892 [Penicillium mononematosum]|uniref:uncharacterized protein n=1 Tax=Penicillium mononematosum TaxID=268346 RepID=UPI002547A4BC|nr:uncharacterized protein N7519_004892 [Penicillium mononematosum]KAJ6183591.1 hypothetical protein N7519_004892 [Penicillium mononematosum]